MNDELKKDWGQLEEGLTKAMAKLSECQFEGGAIRGTQKFFPVRGSGLKERGDEIRRLRYRHWSARVARGPTVAVLYRRENTERRTIAEAFPKIRPPWCMSRDRWR